jgi:hypothetical protein
MARSIILLLLALLILNPHASASPLFDEDTVLDVQLNGPLDSLISNKKSRTELPFVLTVKGIEHALNVRVRGKSRLRVCKFPPLRFNFSNDETGTTIFAGQEKLKLVTHCREYDRAEKDLLEEFMAYRIFNLVSDLSYRVRLLHITYVDTARRRDAPELKRYGFLIESKNELAARTGAVPVRVSGVSRRLLHEHQAAVVYVFQYLIGNTDFSFVTAKDEDICCHNGDLFDMESRIHYVPYDFDLAGLVNARYAYPHPSLRIRKVTQRLYRGLCTSPEALASALAVIKARRNEILGVVRDSPGLSNKDIEEKVDYLDDFFAMAEDEEALMRSFVKRCL